MDHESLSEITFGLLLGHKIVQEAVRPEMFATPYDRGVELLLQGKPVEMITIKIGPSAVQAAYDAAQSVLGSGLDYVTMLEISGAKSKLADKLINIAKKLRLGDDVDLTEIIEQWNVMNDKAFDMISMYDVEADDEPFIQSGWAAIDQHLLGLPRVGMVTVGGPPGVGKTTFIIQLVGSFLRLYLAKLAAVFTLEMPAAEFKYRAINMREFTEDEQKRVILCDQMLTVEEVSNRAARIGDKLGLIVIDFADLMVRGEMSEPEMAKIYLTCYSLAKRLQLPLILISQLNRNYTGGIPRPTNLRYTSLAEALSWGIWMPYNPLTSFNNTGDTVLTPIPGKAYLICWKMRGGIRLHNNMPGAIRLDWNGTTGWGADCTPQDWFVLRPYE